MSDTVGTNATTKPEFNKFQSMFWPIHGYEMKKFLPMSFLMFFILFVYTMVRDLKDVFIVKYAVCGNAEMISQLKFWFVMPAAILLVMVYSFLINKFGLRKTFYIMVSSFMIFYAIFLFILFPNRNSIHPGIETIEAMRASWPPFFNWIIPCLTNWSFSLFYVLSELWGTMAISSLFWQFANKITMKSEVKRFFGLYAIIGNIGVVLSGGSLKALAKWGKDHDDAYINICIGTCIACGIASMALYYYINAVVLKDPKLYDSSLVKEKKKKEKVGIMDGIKILVKSPYLGLICAITPLILTILGGAFFILVLYGKFVSPEFLGVSALQIAVWFGLFAGALSKCVKYCLFDSTKNMAYLPLDDDTKIKGQAAVEVIGGRAGKAGSSLIQILLINVIAAGSDLTSHLVTLVVIFSITVTGWISSVFGLSKKYEAKVSEKAE